MTSSCHPGNNWIASRPLTILGIKPDAPRSLCWEIEEVNRRIQIVSANVQLENRRAHCGEHNWWLVRATYVVDGRFFGHFFWKVVGSCAHTRESRTATVHGAPYTVNSRVVVGAIYAYMYSYIYRTRCTIHGELTCGGGGNIRIHVYLQLPYTVHRTRWTHVWRGHSRVGATHVWRGIHVWRGHSRVGAIHMWRRHSRVGTIHVWRGHSHVEGTFTCGGDIHVWRGHSRVGVIHVWRGHSHVGAIHVWRRHSHVGTIHVWRGHSRVEGTFMCGGDIHVWELFMCGGDIHMWELFTCGGGIHLWELFMCGGDKHSCVGAIHVWRGHSRVGGIHVWELFTCGTSHQNEILHSLIFIRSDSSRDRTVSHSEVSDVARYLSN